MSIGIDLGTTFSCVGYYENGVVQILENENGCRTTPSVLAIDDDGEWLIGQHAKDVLSAPNNCVFDVKRIIGRCYNDVLLQKDMPLWPFVVEKYGTDPRLVLQSGSKRHVFSPVQISAHILRKLKENAERKLGVPVQNAVITVPAYFNAAQRRSTQEAGELAGLNVLRILNEPTAAAIAYSLHGERLSKRNILIYDLGGGTFDVAVVNIDGSSITVKAKGGDIHLGGEDIDNILMLKMVEVFKAETGVDLKGNYRALKRLRKAAETAKITLSACNNARVMIDCIHENLDLKMKVTRQEFEQMIECLLYSTMVHVERAIREAGIKKQQINEIVLVGGSTRIPKLKEILRNAFPYSTKICENIHPDEAVAYGAAVMAAVLSGVEEVQDMRMNDTIPLSIGIQQRRDAMSVLIKRGSKFPCKFTNTFVNTIDYQTTIDVPIYEGERALCTHNHHLGDISMPITPRLRGHTVVEITLEVDHNGILQATAVDTLSKKEISTAIVYDHSTYTKEEVAQMLSNYEDMRKADDSFRRRYKQLQKSEDNAFDLRQRLLSAQNAIEEEKHKQLIGLVDDEIRWLADFPSVSCDEYQKRRRYLRWKCNKTLWKHFSF